MNEFNDFQKYCLEMAEKAPDEIEIDEQKIKPVTKKDLSVVGVPLRYYEPLSQQGNIVDNEFMKAIAEWNHKEKWCLIFSGNVGTGKSFAAAKWIMDHRPDKLSWLSAGELADYKYNEYRLFKELCGRYRLVIDDWGTEYDTASNISMSIFRMVIDRRHANELPTIITTNMTGNEIKKRYNDPRIRDRLRQGLFVFSDRSKSLRK